MDVWIIAAAAGAGFVAQRLRSLSVGNRSWPKWSSETLLSVRSEFPLSINKALDQNGSMRKCLEELYRQRDSASEDASNEETPSHSEIEGHNQSVQDSDCNEDDIADSQIVVRHDADEVKACELSLNPSLLEIGSCSGGGSKQGKVSLRSSRRINREFIVMPQTSLESCLMAQICNEDAEFEEKTFCKHAALSAISLHFRETENRIIASPVLQCSHEPTANDHLSDHYSVELAETVTGTPRLRSIASMKIPVKARKMAVDNREKFEGSSNPLFLFFIGWIVGFLSSFSGNRREIENLRRSLKQTKNLVEDLQEELDMKDALTVKELYIEDDVSQHLSCVEESIRTSSYSNEEQQCHQSAEEEESFKQIEAELEAELDRLQSNVNPSRLEEGILSHVVGEMYPDFELDIAEGELRPECFSGRDDNSEHYTAERSSRPTPCYSSVHYPISPRLLSLKLHEVIQSRLKDRIEQLEAALERFKRGGSSSGNIAEQPVVISLPGEEALAFSYGEELASDEEAVSGNRRGTLKDGISNGYQRVVSTDECGSWNQSENDDDDDDDDGDDGDDDDEMERLLIQQIVEKARQGSPSVLKAKWALLS